MLQINKNQLKQFYKKCQKDKLIGIDTEFYRVDTYYPKLCLIQLANNSDSIFLDPITQDLDYKLLKKLLFKKGIFSFDLMTSLLTFSKVSTPQLLTMSSAINLTV